jgi:Nucleotidyl transferase AbiEii toxin, Type IV TA system
MDLHPDFRDLLAEFARENVNYAVIGGYAVGHHARPRATKDLDLLVSPSGDNLERVARALERFGAAPNVVAAVKNLGEAEVVYLGVPPVRVDILRSADGIDDVDATLARAERASPGDLTIPILALDDLIANKRAAARPQDLADVALLERVRDRR